MRRRVFAAVAVACSAPVLAVVVGAPIGKAGRGELEGQWQATALEMEGAARPDPESVRVVIKGDELTIHLPGGEARKSKFKADAGKTPAAIDLTPGYGEFAGRVCAGIYELDKDRLRLCVIDRGDRGRDPGARPTAFKTEPGDGLALVTLRRVK